MSARTHLITGVANEWSIAWACAERLLQDGERCYLTCLPANRRRVERLAATYGAAARVLPVDVSNPDDVALLAREIEAGTDRLHGLLHAVAFAEADDLQAGVLETSRAGFLKAMEISVYSLVALTSSVRRLLGAGSSVVALTYSGSQRCVPGYGVMGVAKAALESMVRYLAYELGASGVRVNSVSPGPILTLSSSVFEDIDAKIEQAAARSPLRSPTTQADVADLVRYLFSPAAGSITGQCVFVDNGLSAMGGP